MVYNLLRLLIVVALGFLFGKLASKLKMPAVLGFLIVGMALGPNAANLLTQEILDAPAYERLISVLECGMGLMLGTEMVWKRMRRYGKQVLTITLTESLGTFLVVSAASCAIFYLTGVPVFLGLVFGGIALATAPTPALSIVTEYHTDGPVTRTLIPLAVLDDVAAITVFLGVMSVVLKQTSGSNVPGLPDFTGCTVPRFDRTSGWTSGICSAAQEPKSKDQFGHCTPRCPDRSRDYPGSKYVSDALPDSQLYADRYGVFRRLCQPYSRRAA